MPKLKTVKSASKRIAKITKSGKILRFKISAQHLARKKSKRTKKEAKKKLAISKADLRKIKRLIPYGAR